MFEIRELPALTFKGYIQKISVHNRAIDIPDFWAEVTSDEQFAPLYRSMDNLGIVGVSYNFTEDDSDYLVGVHSTEGDISFEAGKYAFFIVKGRLPGSVRKYEQDALKEIKDSGYSFDGVILEVYPEGDPSSDEYITEVYFMIRRV